AAYEVAKVTKVHGENEKLNLPEVIAGLFIVLYYVGAYAGTAAPQYGAPFFCMMVLVFGYLCIFIVYVLNFPKYHASQIVGTLFAMTYPPVLLSFWYYTRMLDHGAYFAWMIFICSWVCDTAAYIFGSLFGKHKMAPVLSPKKSVEGAIGGIFGAALVGWLYALVLTYLGVKLEYMYWAFPLVSAIGALFSQIGDLTASALKRDFEQKDYGNLIPGHGGIMDRFDSVLFTAPFIYYLVLLIY
nr:phosphatidate cytidylyltransferase [Lachnospiraceae bacterium]